MYPYFSPSCYKGFGDDPQGFYGVYYEVNLNILVDIISLLISVYIISSSNFQVFSKLITEETDFLDDPEEVTKIPTFGNSTTPYEEVNEFYAYWMAFSTNKSM